MKKNIQEFLLQIKHPESDQKFISEKNIKLIDIEDNKVILKNSLTTINQNNILTNISAGYAIVSNDYDNFDFSNKVRITKKTRGLTLETQTLIGSLKKGNFYTNDKVKIISGNTRINGTGLDFKKNGEYIKIGGNAVLIMLLSKKNGH